MSKLAHLGFVVSFDLGLVKSWDEPLVELPVLVPLVPIPEVPPIPVGGCTL